MKLPAVPADPWTPLLPSASHVYVVQADRHIEYLLRTPPGAEISYLVDAKTGDTVDNWWHGVLFSPQGAFETIQKVSFRPHPSQAESPISPMEPAPHSMDQYTVVMEYGAPYLRPVWHFQIVGREVDYGIGS